MLAAIALAAALLAPLQDEDGFRSPTVVAGRLLRPDGAPAVGAALLLRGRSRSTQLPSWEDPTDVTDEDGRFRLEFVPPRGYLFSLTAELEGHAPSLWSWEALELGEVVDLGEVAFLPAGTLVGSIVGKDGEIRVNGWWVRAAARFAPGDGRDPVIAWAVVDPESTEFRLEGLPPGPARVTARHTTGFETVPLDVEVVARLETSIELLHEGPDPERQLVIRIDPSPYHFAETFLPRAILVAPDGTMFVRRGGGTHQFDDLTPGEYSLRVDEPMHATWSQSGLRPGGSVRVQLRGAARLALEVVDAESGLPLPDYGVGILRYENWEIEATHSDGLIDGLAPMEQTVVVHVPGRPATSVVVEGLAAGETLPLRVEIPPARRIEGRVVDADGVPAADVPVEWTPGTIAGCPGPAYRVGMPRTSEVVRTDAAGRFVFSAVGPGPHTIRAHPSPWLWCDRTIEPGADDVPLELTLPPAGYVAGRLDLPEGFDPRTLHVQFTGADFDYHVPGTWTHDCGAVEGDGRFRYGPLPTGELRMRAMIGDVNGGRISGSLRASAELPVVIEAGTTTAVTWDLWAELPGTVEVTAFLDSAPLLDAGRVTFVTAGGQRADGPAHAVWRADVLTRTLPPGAWHALVIAAGDEWQWRDPAAFTIEPGGTTTIECDVPLVAREVRCVDPETGAPLARTRIAAWTGDLADRPGVTTARTNRRGIVRLVLPNGPVQFSRGPDPPSRRPVVPPAPALVPVEWVEGAAPIELALPPLER